MMKFGRNLPRNQVPEYSAYYIDYKGLKKLIKAAAEERKHGEEVDLAEIFFSLDRNLERVDEFYNKRSADISRRLKLLFERHGLDVNDRPGLGKQDVEDLIGALLEIRTHLRKLQWFGDVNRRGFIKITKKLDKKITSACVQRRYLTAKVEPKNFAASDELVKKINSVNDWLSQLADYKPDDDASSIHSASSYSKGQANGATALPKQLLDEIDRAIRNDDVVLLTKVFLEARDVNEDENVKIILLNLLQRAISARAKACTKTLLARLPDLTEENDLNDRNCIHRLVIAIGRTRTAEVHRQDELSTQEGGTRNCIVPAEVPNIQVVPYHSQEAQLDDLINIEPSVQLLEFLLSHLSPTQGPALTARDGYGRVPLHYAAQYGLTAVCEMLIQCMRRLNEYQVSEGIDSPDWQDQDSCSPLHLSVLGGHFGATKILLDSFKLTQDESDHAPQATALSKTSNVLALATLANYSQIVQCLVEAGADMNYSDGHEETPLHVAARHGRVGCAKAMLSSKSHLAQVDIPEKVFGWTPLHLACVDGQIEMAEVLIRAGANIDRCDLSGWTAKEHAALRGHMDIAERLHEVTETIPDPGLHTSRPALTRIISTQGDAKFDVIGKDEAGSRLPEPVKSFGHRYLTDECMVLVSLGSMDMRKNVDTVKLDNIPIAKAHATQLDTALSVVVSAAGANGDPTVFDLPVQDSISTEPILFTTKDITKVKLLFDIVPTYAGSKEQVVGRGVALLASIKPSIGSKRSNLQGDISVPIIAAKNLDFIGSVNFNFLIVTPFSHPNMGISENQTYWKSLASPMVIGHRGLGKNLAARKSLQLGENTIQSFIAAANLGASYVEFDVQLTKDHVPVIYHDFLVSETGIDAPVHTLTLEQFLHVNDSVTPSSSMPGSPAPYRNGARPTNSDQTSPRMHRTMSLGASSEIGSLNIEERMKHTRDFKMKGYKGNSRGNTIQAPFATLEEMFQKLPESVGFNIEMKYPMLLESESEEMDTYAVELNSFVDTVLKKVYDLGKKRDIIFSSFHPDICLLLSLKQPSIPVLFLTDAGTQAVSDIRASSLQEAIRFASRWNLLGIVTNSEPLVLCPRLVRVVKESGLVCVSYGQLNNEPKNVKLQIKEGLDAVIVDSVLAIRKGLTHNEAEDEEKEQVDVASDGFPPIDGIPVSTCSTAPVLS